MFVLAAAVPESESSALPLLVVPHKSAAGWHEAPPFAPLHGGDTAW